jgi:hypothetical protein
MRAWRAPRQCLIADGRRELFVFVRFFSPGTALASVLACLRAGLRSTNRGGTAMQVRRTWCALVFAGLASCPVWGGYTLALETPRAAAEIAPRVAAELQYEAFAPPEAARANPTGFEVWAASQHRAAREGLTQRPPTPTCLVSGFGNAPL